MGSDNIEKCKQKREKGRKDEEEAFSKREKTAKSLVKGEQKVLPSHLPIEKAIIFMENLLARVQDSKEDHQQQKFTKEETKVDGQVQTGNKDQLFDFSTSDFATLVATTTFVDKTLLIRDIFYGSSKILITAPPRFGKSTNIDMVKRFVEIEVDMKGTPKPVHTTKNYKLFKDNNLEICKHEEFFGKHFGKRPVVYIDCGPLGVMNDYTAMLSVFKNIIIKTFSQHTYLLNGNNIENLFLPTDCFDINDFKQFFSEQLMTQKNGKHLTYSFRYLSIILCRYFGREVFVLIDNYDAFVISTFSHYIRDKYEVLSLISTTMDCLLKDNCCVERVLLTGVLPVTGVGLPFHGNNVDSHCSFISNIFYKYYGLTADEIDKILEKLIENNEERKTTKGTIDQFYKAYNVAGNQRVYSIWSVLQFLYRKQVQSYWCHHESKISFKFAFENSQIQEKTVQLLLGKDVQLDTSQPLSAHDISRLEEELMNKLGTNKFKTNTKITKNVSSSVVDNFFIVLYHFGYLSVNKISDWGYVSLKIPNEEVKCELAKVLYKINETSICEGLKAIKCL